MHVFVERSISGVGESERICRTIAESTPCLDLHQVRLVESCTVEAGDRIICHFLAPDAESVRQALRGAGAHYDAIRVVSADDGMP